MALFPSFGHILGRGYPHDLLEIAVEGGIVLIPRKARKRGKRNVTVGGIQNLKRLTDAHTAEKGMERFARELLEAAAKILARGMREGRSEATRLNSSHAT